MVHDADVLDRESLPVTPGKAHSCFDELRVPRSSSPNEATRPDIAKTYVSRQLFLSYKRENVLRIVADCRLPDRADTLEMGHHAEASGPWKQTSSEMETMEVNRQ